MPLTKCRECEKEISTEARSCPHCGAPWPAKEEWKGSGVDWKSNATWYGFPLVHVAFGRDAQGKLRVAKGVIAIGQFAVGAIAFAQLGIGIIFGFGQFIFAPIAIGQFAIALLFGLGQIATGYIAIGQVVLAYYGLCQAGYAAHLWSSAHKDPEAVEFFRQLADKARLLADKYLHL